MLKPEIPPTPLETIQPILDPVLARLRRRQGPDLVDTVRTGLSTGF